MKLFTLSLSLIVLAVSAAMICAQTTDAATTLSPATTEDTAKIEKKIGGVGRSVAATRTEVRKQGDQVTSAINSSRTVVNNNVTAGREEARQATMELREEVSSLSTFLTVVVGVLMLLLTGAMGVLFIPRFQLCFAEYRREVGDPTESLGWLVFRNQKLAPMYYRHMGHNVGTMRQVLTMDSEHLLGLKRYGIREGKWVMIGHW